MSRSTTQASLDDAVETSIDSFLASLDLVGCRSIGDMLSRLELLRGRRIVLRNLKTSNTQLTGLWVPSEHVDKIMVRWNMSELHRLHVILHECGHMLLRHHGCTGVVAGSASSVFEETNIQEHLLVVDSKVSGEEAAAEAFAHIVGPFFLHSALSTGNTFEMDFE